MVGENYYDDDVGLVYTTTYDFSEPSRPVPEAPIGGFQFVRDGDEIPDPDEIIVTVSGIDFDQLSSNNITSAPQIGALSNYTVRGYRGQLADTEQDFSWQFVDAMAIAGQDDTLPMWILREETTDRATNEVLSIVRTPLALAQDGNVYAFSFTNSTDFDEVNAVVDGIFAFGEPAVDTTWTDTAEIAWIVTNNSSTDTVPTPSGYEATLVIQAVDDAARAVILPPAVLLRRFSTIVLVGIASEWVLLRLDKVMATKSLLMA